MKKHIIILLACACFTSTYAQDKEIETLFNELNHYVVSGDTEGIERHINPGNIDFINKTELRYANILKLDSLSYHLKLNSLSIDGTTATAVAFERSRYFRHNRYFSESQWQTYTLSRINGAWYIDNMEKRNYLKADYMNLNVRIDTVTNTITGKAEVDITVLEDGENNILFWLNRGLNITSITDEKGTELEFERSGLEVLIPTDQQLFRNEKRHLVFFYSGTFFNEHAESNYCLSYLGPEGYFANFVTEWYPKLNSTYTKSKATLTYTVPKGITVASVGKLTDKKESEGRLTYTYTVGIPMDYTFNANKFTSYYETVDGVSVNVFLFNENPEKAKMYAQKAAHLLSVLSDFYGVFPSEGYTISEVPSSITMDLGGAGGQGLNFYPEFALRDTVFEFPLIAHEMGHAWWGSLVKCKESAGALFDEGMAQFSSVIAYRLYYGEKAMWDFLNDGDSNYPQSAKMYFQRFSSNDIPLGYFDVDRSADLTTLARVKAHYVFAMLMETVGYFYFEKGMKRVVSEYTDRRIGLDDFKLIMEEESGLNLDWFFEQWFYRTGAPEFTIESTVAPMEDGRYRVDGLITQLREIYDVKAEIEFSYDYHRIIKDIRINDRETRFSYILETKPNAIVFDPDRKILRWSEETKHLPLLHTGMMNMITGNTQVAIDSLTKYLEYRPFDATGNALLGIAYVNLKQYEEALPYLSYAEEKYAKEGGDEINMLFLYLAIGEYYFENTMPEKAKTYFEKVLRMVDFMGSHEKALSFLEMIE